MGKKKTKIDASTLPVPQDRAGAEAAIFEIGDRERRRLRIEADMNDELAIIKKNFEKKAQPHADRVTALLAGIQIWAAANRETLTQGGKTKTVPLTTGVIKWRMTPKSVGLRKVAEVISALKKAGLDRFIRSKDEVNKDAILLEEEAVKGIKGIKISQQEEFVVEPFNAELEAGG